MQVTVNHKTLTKALDNSNDRIVLGTGVFGFVYIILSIWVAAAAGMCLFFWSAFSSMPGAGTINLKFLPIAGVAGAAGLAYLLGGWQNRLIFDLSNRTYLEEYGLPPLMTRQRGSLDSFSHFSLTRQSETHGGNGTRHEVYKLTLIPKEGSPAAAPPTKPIVISFAYWGQQGDTTTYNLSQRLAERVSLPMRDESQVLIPEPKTSGWCCVLILCPFVLFVASISAYNAYMSRGPRFPVILGAVQSLNATLGSCRVRTMEVKKGTSYTRHGVGGGGPDGGGSYTSTYTPYKIVLDIENPGAKLDSVNFVIGFNATGRVEGSSGFLTPHAHRRVTVEIESSGENQPTELFIRSEN